MLASKNMIDDYCIVLIHGAGLGSFIWDELTPMLDIPVIAINFPNRNKGDKANAQLTFNNYIQSIIEQIKNCERRKIILVVHSIRGCIGLKIADHLEKNLAGFIAICANLPRNEESFVSGLPFPKNILMPIILRLFGTKPTKKSIGKELCNDLTAGQTAKIIDNFTPESRLLYTTILSYKMPAIKKLYIKCTKDNSLTVLRQDEMIKNLNIQSVETIKSGHLPMLSFPKKTAQIINEFANSL
ncbi:MAG: alpha/beta fold hydrolase [Chitinophagaceae bacterium]